MSTIGAGIGGFAAIVAQPTYGANFVTPTRTLVFKSGKSTYDPHWVQGGPYLQGGQPLDYGSANVQTWLDAKGTLTGDVCSTANALLLATAMGSPAALTEIGTSAAYFLGTSPTPVSLSVPDKQNGGSSGCCFDMQWGVPTDDATLHAENYHSCMIQKAEWVFERGGFCTFSYDFDSQYVETTSALITPSYASAPVPFAMENTTSAFKVGAFGSESQLAGIRKATFTLERKLQTDRAYLGVQYKELPVTNDVIGLTVALETDYTAAAKTALFDLFLTGAATSVVCSAIGATIGASAATFALNATNCTVQTGGESPLDGPAIVKNTITLKGTLNAAANYGGLGLTYITGDTTF